MSPSRLLLLLLVACGGTPSRRPGVIPASSGPVDVAAMRALLER